MSRKTQCPPSKASIKLPANCLKMDHTRFLHYYYCLPVTHSAVYSSFYFEDYFIPTKRGLRANILNVRCFHHICSLRLKQWMEMQHALKYQINIYGIYSYLYCYCKESFTSLLQHHTHIHLTRSSLPGLAVFGEGFFACCVIILCNIKYSHCKGMLFIRFCTLTKY